MYADDTITAITTAPGAGGVGIIRVSGSQSLPILARVFRGSKAPATWDSHRLYFGVICTPGGDEIDQGLAVLMRGPHSYTGEDVAELHCHGSPVLLRRVLESVLSSGARPAEPGEFTKRAFLNGRMDLTQAEAVIDAITARTPQAATLAVRQLSGAVSAWINELRNKTIRLKALLEAQIDFAEEDFNIDPSELLRDLDECEKPLARILSTYQHGKLIRDGLRIAIVGKPNVGKSSLLNALLGEDRAIVTAFAGTTRDLIEESLDLDGIPFVVADTAGLRDSERAEPVEKIGMELTRSSIARSDLVLVVIDRSQPLSTEDRAVLEATSSARRLIVLNKTDLPAQLSASHFLNDRIALVSARDHRGLDDLRRLLVQASDDHPTPKDTPVLTRSRHFVALTKAAQSLALARRSISEGRSPDLVAVDVQDALDYLGTVTGLVTNEDILDRIFEEFCVGK